MEDFRYLAFFGQARLSNVPIGFELHGLFPLKLSVLDLEPMPGLSSADIGAGLFLADNSFKPLLGYHIEKLLAMFFDVVNIENISHGPDKFLQKGRATNETQFS